MAFRSAHIIDERIPEYRQHGNAKASNASPFHHLQVSLHILYCPA